MFSNEHINMQVLEGKGLSLQEDNVINHNTIHFCMKILIIMTCKICIICRWKRIQRQLWWKTNSGWDVIKIDRRNKKIDYYRPPEGGRLFDMKVVSSYVFLRTYYVWKKSKDKMLNMLLLIREMCYYLKKIIYLN